jgi:alkylation response protein AidB-like acyl-CoA dehydrogenase
MQPLEIPSHEKLLARIEDIGPGLRAAASDCDAARQVLPASMKAMVDAGLFRTTVPRAVGGYELSLRTFHQAVLRTSEFCPSSGWVLMVMGGHHHVLGSFPAQAQQEVFGDGREGLVAGTLSPQGVAEAVEGGFKVNGRWQFCSGVDRSDWVMLGCATADGRPFVHVIAPTEEIVVDDTWHVLGLQGTGSKDVVARDLFVPAHRAAPTPQAFVFGTPESRAHATNLYYIPVIEDLAFAGAAAVLGSARYALEAFLEHTKKRKNMVTGARKAEHVPTQLRAAEASIELHAAELLLHDAHAEFDRLMAAGERADLAHIAKYQWQAAYITELSRRAVNRVFEGSGAHAVYRGGAVQTAFRNVNEGAQHASLGFDACAEVRGRMLLQ